MISLDRYACGYEYMYYNNEKLCTQYYLWLLPYWYGEHGYKASNISTLSYSCSVSSIFLPHHDLDSYLIWSDACGWIVCRGQYRPSAQGEGTKSNTVSDPDQMTDIAYSVCCSSKDHSVSARCSKQSTLIPPFNLPISLIQSFHQSTLIPPFDPFSPSF